MAIERITDLKQVTKYLTQSQHVYTTLLLDIDEVLLYPLSEPNCNEVFAKEFHTLQARYSKAGEFYSYCNKEYLQLVTRFNKAATETRYGTRLTIPYLFNLWQERADNVLGLTSRGLELAKSTEENLNKLNIRFPYIEKYNAGKSYKPLASRSLRSGYSRRNIAYCGGMNKGEILKEYIETVKKKMPKVRFKFVFVDDGLFGLQQVEKVCKRYGIEYIGLHYVYRGGKK